MTTNHNDIIPIYFKVIRTCHSKIYDINIYWTTEEFINTMREKVMNDFNLENAEFVDTVQKIPQGTAAEDAVAMQPSSETLINYYGNCIYQMALAFYIRPIPSITISYLEPSSLSCAICLERERSIVFIPCNHLCACRECGFNPTIRSCPICREDFINRLTVYV